MTKLTLPGLIDVHTHLRVPGGEHKETFATGSAAALAGGITMILGMPNTSPPLTNAGVLREARDIMRREIVCDIGLYAGASAEDLTALPEAAEYAVALKIYLNDTFGKLRVDAVPTMMGAFKLWPREKLIAFHAEQQSVAVAIGLAATYDRAVHIVHVSRREEIELIADAKMRGLKVTCEVAPHHLFMTHADRERMGALAYMRPVLGSADDVSALWEHINDTVDCIATDHAPHTLDEKRSDDPPPGIVGLETSLPLMATAMADGKLSPDRLIALMHDNPKRIYNLPDQPDTHVEFDMSERVKIRNSDLKTKVGWTPFDGWEVAGRVSKVVLRGTTVFEDGEVLVEGGFGRILPN